MDDKYWMVRQVLGAGCWVVSVMRWGQLLVLGLQGDSCFPGSSGVHLQALPLPQAEVLPDCDLGFSSPTQQTECATPCVSAVCRLWAAVSHGEGGPGHCTCRDAVQGRWAACALALGRVGSWVLEMWCFPI